MKLPFIVTGRAEEEDVVLKKTISIQMEKPSRDSL